MSDSFVLSGGVGFCNAIRRTLLSDLTMWAPKELLIRSNTSCQTDEYIAHRIGLIPFKKTGEGESITLSVKTAGMVRSNRFTGHAFEPIHDEIDIIVLDEGQELDVTIFFDQQKASKHSRYSPCAAVGMTKIDETRHKISFDSVGHETPKELILSALDHFDERVDRALRALSTQPNEPPQSMC